jgi:methionyl-tRNA formyltransferase
MSLRVVFMGTPEFSVATLNAVADAGHHIIAVYSQPPRPGGRRGLEPQPSPVHQAAIARGIPVYVPKTLKAAEEHQQFKDLGTDVAVVVAYGLLLPKAILDAPRLGCLNGHASKLPRWRGAAPIHRAIMAGDRETAMMIMRMEQGLDTGPVCLSAAVPITSTTTTGDLHAILAQRGASLMVEALDLLENGNLSETRQSEVGVTYAAKITKDEAEIDFTKPATEVLAHIHGLSPSPGAWFEAAPVGGAPERIKVLRARTNLRDGAAGHFLNDGHLIGCAAGSGSLELIEVVRAGKKPMQAGEFLRGFLIGDGSQISPGRKN